MSIPKTLLAFDFGMKYIGVAVGQSVTKTASPLTSLLAQDGIPKWPEIKQLIAHWKPECLVVGIPLNMDGTAQDLTHRATKFANRLKERFGLPVEAVDERLSTVAARQRTQPNASLSELNATAAAILLEQWFKDRK